MSPDDATARIRIYVRRLGFLRFAIAPALAVIMLSATFEIFATEVTGAPPQISASPTGEIASRYAGAAPWFPVAGAAPAPPAPRPAPQSAPDAQLKPLAISQGRFDWMAFFMTANAIFAATIALSIRTMWRNTGGSALCFWGTLSLGVGLSVAWMAWIMTPQSETTDLLVGATATLALARYNAAFADAALAWSKFNFASGLVATVFVILGGASVMAKRELSRRRHAPPLRKVAVARPGDIAGTPALSPDDAEAVASLDAKSGDLKMMIVTGSIMIAFLVTYDGFWLRWPLSFLSPEVLKAPNLVVAEISSTAAGLQLFFGTGYTIILLAIAGPTVIALSNKRLALKVSPPGGAKPLGQSLFSASEIAALLSVAGPFVLAMLGTKLGVPG